MAFTLWLTGLPCSGKSSLAVRSAQLLRSQGCKVEILDGDDIRKTLSRDLGFSKKDRDIQVQRIGFVAHLLTRNGIVAIVAAVSPYRAAREANRHLIRDYVEAYVRCPLEICMERDCKEMYKKAAEGTIPAFTGLSDPYEEPENPEIIIDTDQLDEGESAHKILDRLVELRRLIPVSSQAAAQAKRL